MWADVLDRADIGIDEDFFDLGGHSLIAIRVVERLRRPAPDGTAIAVMDLFTHPTIRRLAPLLEGDATTARGVLHRLTPQRSAEPGLSVVAVPFGGGGATVYASLANALPATHALWSVAIPGHDPGIDEPHAPLEDVATRCVQQIQDDVAGPVALYGHCGVGSALVVAIARRLEEAGRVPEAVYIGAIFPFARPGRALPAALGRLANPDAVRSDRSYARGLTALGLDLSAVGPARARHIVATTRRDTDAAEDYFTELFATTVRRLRAPVISVAGEHDPATEYHRERFREWHFLTDTTAVVLLDDAGHYFQDHRAAELAEIVTTTHPAVAAGEPAGGDAWRLLDVSRGGPRADPDGAAPDRPRPSTARFLTVAAAQLSSIGASALTAFAVAIWVYLGTGSLLRFALAVVAGVIPGLLAAPLAGDVVDRCRRRTTILAGGGAAAGIQLLLGLLLWTGSPPVWPVYPLLALLSVAVAVQRLAFDSAVPQLAPKRYLDHATGIVATATAAGRLVVPGAAVGLLVISGLPGLLVLVVSTQAVTLVVTVLTRFPRTVPASTASSASGVVAGFRYTWADLRLRRMLIFFAALHGVLAPLLLLVPPLVLAAGSLADVGRVLLGAGLAGAVGGVVTTAWGGPRRRRMRVVLLGTLGLAVFCVVAGVRADPVAIGVGVFGMVLSLTVLGGIRAAIVESTVPQRFHARVAALDPLLSWSALPIGFGLVAAYVSGLFEPLLLPGGALAPTAGALIGTGPARGIALLYLLAALAVALVAAAGLLTGWARTPDGPDAIPDDPIGVPALGSTGPFGAAGSDHRDAAVRTARSAGRP